MDNTRLQALLAGIADYATRRRHGDANRAHAPQDSYRRSRERFDFALTEEGAPAEAVIKDLIARSEPGLAAMTGPRFYGWVIGASHPVGLAADWLTGLWGQNAGNHLASPASAAAEDAAGVALLRLLALPAEASIGYVTGATMANFTCLAAARGEVLRRAGWDVEGDGLFGAPQITVVMGDDAHSTVFAALKYLGLGYKRVLRVATDTQGAMRADAFAEVMAPLNGPIIVIAQAGQINTGAFDPFVEIAAIAATKKAWVHVDGAFGLWARATADYKALTTGIDLCDSWAVDGHKWLQTPYDCGFAIVRDRTAHHRSMQIAASYLPASDGDERNPADYVPELSRRARGFATWAMIRHLGAQGIDQMVSRVCQLAARFAERLAAEPGIAIRNDVVINQVAVRLGADLPVAEADGLTQLAIARIQGEGVCFVGGASWRGEWIIRISVSGHATTEADIDASADAIIAAWRAVRAES